MGVSCTTSLHRHGTPPPRPAPTVRKCEGCSAACGPDDVLRTSSGAHPICSSCWDQWRKGGYGRTVRRAGDLAGRRQAKDAKNAILVGLARHEQTVEL